MLNDILVIPKRRMINGSDGQRGKIQTDIKAAMESQRQNNKHNNCIEYHLKHAKKMIS